MELLLDRKTTSTPELQQRWIHALRSGDFPAGPLYLCRNGIYNPFGVLLQLGFGSGREREMSGKLLATWESPDGITITPNECATLGLPEDLAAEVFWLFSQRRYSFPSIANHIEAYWGAK